MKSFPSVNGFSSRFPKNSYFCGDDGVRTRDLVVANHALSQLSYIPSSGVRGQESGVSKTKTRWLFLAPDSWLLTPELGVLGLEPRTSALSELRSSQLSYTPFWSAAPGNENSQTRQGLARSSSGLWLVELHLVM